MAKLEKMDNYCLKWGEFESNIRESFIELRKENNLFDVTLATEDGHQVEAHQVILSAGSKFFSDIFKKTKHQSPFIYLKGIRRVELEKIVDFLYKGEAYVSHEEINKFLEAAQDLQVNGLKSPKGEETIKAKSEVEQT